MSTTLNEDERVLQDELEMYRRLKKTMSKPEGYTYWGVEDFLLQHGQWYRPNGVMPEDVGTPKACYTNALLLAMTRKGYKYIEGMAIANIDVPIAIHHAWNIDAQGNLIDNTWMNRGKAYLGVEFSSGRAENAIWIDDDPVLTNVRSRFALYKDPWTGENYRLRWKKSTKLRRLVRQLKQFAGDRA